jgi:hypothetical protein
VPNAPEHGEGGAKAAESPLPKGLPTLRAAGAVEPRLLAAWREWLAALANDAEAAMAASHVYGELSPEARDAWLDALAEDAPNIGVQPVAMYAPLLAVEADPGRRARCEQAIGSTLDLRPGPVRALRGFAVDGARVAALVLPHYLDFVRVLWCRYSPDEGFVWAQHDAILGSKDAPADGARVDGVTLEATPLKPVIEELAHAILATGRRGLELPSSLHQFADLFDAHVDEGTVP